MDMSAHDFRALPIDQQDVAVDADYTEWEDIISELQKHSIIDSCPNDKYPSELLEDQRAQCQSWLCNEFGHNFPNMHESSIRKQSRQFQCNNLFMVLFNIY